VPATSSEAWRVVGKTPVRNSRHDGRPPAHHSIRRPKPPGNKDEGRRMKAEKEESRSTHSSFILHPSALFFPPRPPPRILSPLWRNRSALRTPLRRGAEVIAASRAAS